MHFEAAKAALIQVTGVDPDAAVAPPAPPAAVPAPVAPVASPAPVSPSPAPALKSEKEVADILAKSEQAVKDLEAKLQDQNLQIEGLIKAVDLVVNRPVRKAITSVDFLGKSETPEKVPSRSEIQAQLNELAKTDLKKSDMERIISFSLGNVGYDQVKDLIKK